VTTVAMTVYSGDNDPASFTRALFGLEPSATRQGRALLSAGGSCGETPDWEKNGGIVAYFVGVFFMFLGIAIVCDDFFVASLEKICEVLRLSDDVAGATFMAAGSSAPELASSAMALINPNAGSEIGVGTIVGSAIFNILIIIGATVIATGNTLQLDWKPVTRDCFFYAAAIGGIVGTFAGGRVDWWEGGIYVAFYATYIVTMMYNVRLMRWLDSFERSDTVRSFKARLSFRSARSEALKEQRSERIEQYRAEQTRAEETRESPSDGPRTAKALWGKIRDDIVKVPKHNFANVVLATAKDWKAKQAVIVHAGGAPGGSAEGDADAHVLTPTMTPGHIRAYRSEAVKAAKLLAARDKAMHERAAAIARAIEEGSIADESEAASSGFPELPEEEDDESSPWSVPEDKKDWPMWALSLPWYAAFQLTIPPCGNPKWEKWYVLSFAMSIVWIGFITHWMVEWCVRIGCI
jgi:sodium/potassium/calcium exchanger 4